MRLAANSNTPAHKQQLKGGGVEFPYMLGDYAYVARMNDYIGLPEAEQNYLIAVESIKLDTTKEFMRRVQISKLNEAYTMLGFVKESRETTIEPLRECANKRFLIRENDGIRELNKATILGCLNDLKRLCGD